MKKYLKFLIIYFCASIIPFPASCLEKLSDIEMKSLRAQAGISVALNDNTIYNSAEYIRLTNAQDLSSYIELQDLESTMNIDCGKDDIDNDGVVGQILIDVLSLANGQAFIQISADDLSLDWDVSIGNINVCGAGGDLGSLAIENITIPKFHVYAGTHGYGLDAEVGFQSRIDSLTFQYNDNPTAPETGSLIFTGSSFAGSFDGTIDDPSSWVARNEFVMGDIYNDNPVTFDVNADHVQIKSTMTGSFRIENVDFNNTDMGMVIMDDINVHRLDIEIPGRGLGNP